MKDRVKNRCSGFMNHTRTKELVLAPKLSVLSTVKAEVKIFAENYLETMILQWYAVILLTMSAKKYITESGTAIFCMLWYPSLKYNTKIHALPWNGSS